MPSLTIEIPQEVHEFCTSNELTPYLDTAIALATRCFDPVHELSIRLRQDPDEGFEYVVVAVVSERGFEETRAGYREFLSDWVAQVPSSAGMKI